MIAKREFTVADEYRYNRASPARWIASHLLRYKHFLFGAMFCLLATNALYSSLATLTGWAFNVVTQQSVDAARGSLVIIALREFL